MDSINTQLRVRYAETDQMGVVYHANYIIWMEVGRVEYFRARGIRYRDMERDEGILLVVVEAHCRYHSPALYDEEVNIRTWIEDANPRMITFGYEMTNAATGSHLATGGTKHVFCGHDHKPKKLPEELRISFGISRPMVRTV
jgi:acyl-CoA thioester hydrolase